MRSCFAHGTGDRSVDPHLRGQDQRTNCRKAFSEQSYGEYASQKHHAKVRRKQYGIHGDVCRKIGICQPKSVSIHEQLIPAKKCRGIWSLARKKRLLQNAK